MNYRQQMRSFHSHITTVVLSAWIQSIIQCAMLTNSSKRAGTILTMYADARFSLWIYKICMIYKHYIFAMRSKNFIGNIKKNLWTCNSNVFYLFRVVINFDKSYATEANINLYSTLQKYFTCLSVYYVFKYNTLYLIQMIYDHL